MSPFIKNLTILVLVYVLTQYQAESETHDLQAKLIKDLIEHYNSVYVRPNRDPVIVGFRFSPTILQFDESSQELQLRGMLALIWDDNRLTWDPEEYGGLNKTHIPLVEDNKPIIWKPELVLNESIDKDPNNFHEETNVAKLYHNGTIQWYTLAITTSYCRVNVQHFPLTNKVQIFCLIDDIIHNESYKKYKKPSGVWDFKLSNPVVGNASYDCSTCYDEEQSYVQYTLLLTRTNHLWYMMNYMFPCIVLMVMTIMILYLSHKKEVDASSFGLTCVLTLFVFLTFLFTQLPATGPPRMAFYVVWLIIQAVFATVYVTIKLPKVGTEDQADITSTSEPTDNSGRDRDNLLEMDNKTEQNMCKCRIYATLTFNYLKPYLFKIIAVGINISSCIVFCGFLISWSRKES